MVLTAPNKQFIDLDLLMDLLKKEKPEDFWFYKDCIVNDDGIYARSLDNHVRALLHGEEWHALEEFSKDIKLNLPCTYDKFAVWARRNRFSNILDGQISSETIKIQGMDEFNEKYESIHGYSFWGDNTQSDADILEIVIDNQTLIDNPIQILIQENNLIKGTEWNYFFVLFSWKGQLEKEKDSIVPSNYINRKDYEDRVTALNKKISEIESCKTNGAFESFVQNGVLSKVELIERQKAVSQIKASRNSSDLSIKKLLDSTVSDLINESKPEDDFSRYFELYVWKEKLEKEAKRITGVDYSDEGRREDRLDLIDEKIKAIDWHLADCPSEKTPNNLSDQKEELIVLERGIEGGLRSPKAKVAELGKRNKVVIPTSYYGLAKFKDRLSELLNKTIYTEDIYRYALDNQLDIYWYSDDAIRVSLSFDDETAKLIKGSDTWEALLYQYIVLPQSTIQVLMSGRDATLYFIDISKNKVISVPNELIPKITNCLVLDQNIKVLQSDNLFVKESDALEFEAKISDVTIKFQKDKASTALSLQKESGFESGNKKISINIQRTADFNKWLKDGSIELEKLIKDDIEKLLIIRNKSLWHTGFEDWWQDFCPIKKTSGRPKKKK